MRITIENLEEINNKNSNIFPLTEGTIKYRESLVDQINSGFKYAVSVTNNIIEVKDVIIECPCGYWDLFFVKTDGDVESTTARAFYLSNTNN